VYKVDLVSRVACLGQLKYSGNEGYWGPLQRPLLTFAWMVNAVRVSLRDLVETIQVCMFLTGAVSRDRSDWSQLAVEYACFILRILEIEMLTSTDCPLLSTMVVVLALSPKCIFRTLKRPPKEGNHLPTSSNKQSRTSISTELTLVRIWRLRLASGTR
jgi:hypothetical protein